MACPSSARVLGARRAQGDWLLVHEPDDAPGTMIGFVPGERLSARREGPMLAVELPPQAPLLAEPAREPERVRGGGGDGVSS